MAGTYVMTLKEARAEADFRNRHKSKRLRLKHWEPFLESKGEYGVRLVTGVVPLAFARRGRKPS